MSNLSQLYSSKDTTRSSSDLLSTSNSSNNLLCMANEILNNIESLRGHELKDMEDINEQFFVLLYEQIFDVETLLLFYDKENKQVDRLQLIIDSLADDCISEDLSHIRSIDIKNKNFQSISNLLSIFLHLSKFIHTISDNSRNIIDSSTRIESTTERKKKEILEEKKENVNELMKKRDLETLGTVSTLERGEDGEKKEKDDVGNLRQILDPKFPLEKDFVKNLNEFVKKKFGENLQEFSKKEENIEKLFQCLSLNDTKKLFHSATTILDVSSIPTESSDERRNDEMEINEISPKGTEEDTETNANEMKRYLLDVYEDIDPTQSLTRLHDDEINRLATNHENHLEEKRNTRRNCKKENVRGKSLMSKGKKKRTNRFRSSDNKSAMKKRSSIVEIKQESPLPTNIVDYCIGAIFQGDRQRISKDVLFTLNRLQTSHEKLISQLKKKVLTADDDIYMIRNVTNEHRRRIEKLLNEEKHLQRAKDMREKKKTELMAKNAIRERRGERARAMKEYEEFQSHLKSRIASQQSIDEVALKRLYRDLVKKQKTDVLQTNKWIKNEQETLLNRRRDQLASIENYYKDKYELLANCIEKETSELKKEQKENRQNQLKCEGELKRTMKNEIRNYQKIVKENENISNRHWREIEVESAKNFARKTNFFR